MQAVTYGQIDNKVRKDLDLQDTDNFIGNDEMAGYANDAIDLVEAIILKIDEDYFSTRATLSLVQGTSDILLPSDMYAQKIRALNYVNGTRIYPVKRVKDPNSFLAMEMANQQINGSEEYSYVLRMDSGSAQAVLEIVPTPYESGALLKLRYIRNAQRVPLIEEGSNRAAQIATILDIPEWRICLEQYMKMRCYEKMKDKVAEEKAEKKFKDLLVSMTDTLTARTPDRDDVLPQDLSHYEEMN